MKLEEKRIDRTDVFSGRIVNVHVDHVLLPNGKTSSREVIYHPGGVGIVALDAKNRVIVVKQFRYVFGSVLTEIPAGKLERGEEPRAAALRELREETGAIPGDFIALGKLYASPGCYGEVLHLYLARDLTFGKQALDENEFLNVERIPFDTLVARITDGTICDAKTVAGVLKARAYLGL